VLAWQVQGCLEWQREGLNPPDCVRAATDDLRRSMDGLADFFDDRCSFGDTMAWTLSEDIQSAYTAWADEQRIPIHYRVSAKRLGDALSDRGCVSERSRDRSQSRGWRGIDLVTDTTDRTAASFKTSPTNPNTEKVLEIGADPSVLSWFDEAYLAELAPEQLDETYADDLEELEA
jgi:phage/plasmid-associated DNA primase